MEGNLMFEFVDVSDGEKLDLGFECPNKACRAYHYTFLADSDFVVDD